MYYLFDYYCLRKYKASLPPSFRVFGSIAHWVQKAIKSQAKSMIRNLYDTGLWLVGTMCKQQ